MSHCHLPEASSSWPQHFQISRFLSPRKSFQVTPSTTKMPPGAMSRKMSKLRTRPPRHIPSYRYSTGILQCSMYLCAIRAITATSSHARPSRKACISATNGPDHSHFLPQRNQSSIRNACAFRERLSTGKMLRGNHADQLG
jgi:hypothetical protein